MSNIVIEYQILLLNSKFRVSQRFRVDGDIFENGPRVDTDLFIRMKKDAFSKRSGYVWTCPLKRLAQRSVIYFFESNGPKNTLATLL